MYAVAFYEVDPEQFHRAAEVFPRHRAYLDEFAKDGALAMIGALGNPAEDGSMAVFRSRQAAEAFRASDPFVLEGVVSNSRIVDWDPLVFPATN
ncbi:MAG: uncharacterized protein QOF36_1643 [Microbacteriaceae bacterium]|jgi:uncharacterized protein YciI|nr:uncharacterized protein [Microbacteriaceae bacterium]